MIRLAAATIRPLIILNIKIGGDMGTPARVGCDSSVEASLIDTATNLKVSGATATFTLAQPSGSIVASGPLTETPSGSGKYVAPIPYTALAIAGSYPLTVVAVDTGGHRSQIEEYIEVYGTNA